MSARTTFANLSSGYQLLSLFDNMFSDLGAATVVPCTATGTNSIALAELSNKVAPSSYANHQLFAFVAAATSTGSVTVNFNSIGAKNLYHQNGTTQVGSGDIVSGAFYVVAYYASLNSGSGGFYLTNGDPSVISLLDNAFTLQDNADTTKQLQFQLSGITTETTRTLTAPDADTTIVGTDATQTLSNKTFVAPALGTPASGVMTNVTGLPISTGLAGAGTGVLAALAVNVGSAGAPVLFNGAGGTPSSITLTSATGLPVATGISGLGTGVATALAVNVGSAGAFVTFNGALGTPSSGTATNITGLPISTGLSGAGTGVLAALQVNVGSAGAPVLFNGAGGTPASLTLTNATGLPIASGVSGLGTGIATALAVNTGSAGAPVLFNGAGGTPSSLTLTNATGLPIATGVSGLAAGIATFLATPSSANLASAVTDETGSGALVFGTSPSITTPTFPDYTQFSEIASPSNPAADNLRLFAKDVGGATHLFTRDSGGTEVDLTLGGGSSSAATQAEQETATSTSAFVTPGRQQFHPSACKGWVQATTGGAASASYNVTSVGDAATGQVTINWATDMSVGNFCSVATVESNDVHIGVLRSITDGTSLIYSWNLSAANADPSGGYHCAVFGDQ